MRLAVVFFVFFCLVIWTLAFEASRRKALARSLPQWLLDFAGLSIHGTVVPLFETFIIYGVLSYIFPAAKQSLDLPGWLAFSLNFIVVDYFYYWNHRLLHSEFIWRQHAIHHSGETLDIFTTSRNSAWTTFLILYVWVNGVMLFLLKDPAPYAWGIAASNIFDLLRHVPSLKWPRIFPFTVFISSRDHAWHHSRDLYGVNFGGNFNLWDRLHGTYHASEVLPEAVGADIKEKSLWYAFWKGST